MLKVSMVFILVKLKLYSILCSYCAEATSPILLTHLQYSILTIRIVFFTADGPSHPTTITRHALLVRRVFQFALIDKVCNQIETLFS